MVTGFSELLQALQLVLLPSEGMCYVRHCPNSRCPQVQARHVKGQLPPAGQPLTPQNGLSSHLS